MTMDKTPLPLELDLFARSILDRVQRAPTRAAQRDIIMRALDAAGVPKGLPVLKADFNHPGKNQAAIEAYRRAWIRQHHESIQMNLRPGMVPTVIGRNVVEIPIAPNIVTNRMAQKLLRDVLAPSSTNPMIGQYSTDAESKYKWMAINAMGVGTNDGAAAVGDTGLGAGVSPKNQYSWYHGTTSGSGTPPTAGIDDDLVLDQAYGADVWWKDTGAVSGVNKAYVAAASAAFKLKHVDAAPNYDFTYEVTWDFGTSGDEIYGNFGSDASPDSWREIGLANTPPSDTITSGGAHPNLAHHLATRKVFAGNGFAKTSSVKLTNTYTVRFTSG